MKYESVKAVNGTLANYTEYNTLQLAVERGVCQLIIIMEHFGGYFVLRNWHICTPDNMIYWF